jgi:hypothetical protein
MRFIGAVLTALLLVTMQVPLAVAQNPTVGQQIEDGAITAIVKSKLVAARAGNFSTIDVDTTNGVVRLAGTVPTASDRAEAERLAQGTNGVQQVVNELRIEPRAAGGTADDATSASPDTAGFRGRHTMTGEVTSIDASSGEVQLQTPHGPLSLHFPPASLTGVRRGDTLTVELAMRPGS